MSDPSQLFYKLISTPQNSPPFILLRTVVCSNPGFSFRKKARRLPVMNLKEEIKNLIFPVSGPVCVSENEEKFKDVMTVLYQYEQMVSESA